MEKFLLVIVLFLFTLCFFHGGHVMNVLLEFKNIDGSKVDVELIEIK